MGRAPWRRRPEADRDEEAVRLAIAAGEVGSYAERPVTSLSGGERARVAFARSYAQECEIALLDEPTASLDIRHQHRVLAHTRRRVASGGAAIVVLHDLALAAAYADRVALLEAGRLVAVGPPREVLRPELLSRVYRHPINVVDGPGGALIVVADPTADVSDSLEERTA
jgi:iron complex transport system ATP-binding protein